MNDLLIEHYGFLRKFAQKLTGNPARAEDLAHNTALRILENAHLYRADSNFRAWAGKIMYNLFVTDFHKQKRETGYDPEPLINKMTTPARQENEYAAKAALATLEKLPAAFKEILTLAAWGHSYDEIGAAIGIPVGTVRSRMSRAREAFFRYEQAGIKAVAKAHPGARQYITPLIEAETRLTEQRVPLVIGCRRGRPKLRPDRFCACGAKLSPGAKIKCRTCYCAPENAAARIADHSKPHTARPPVPGIAALLQQGAP